MAWIPTSVPTKSFPAVSWDELAELEKGSPGLTRVPPAKLVSTAEIESVRKSLLRSQIVSEALTEANVGRKKRALVLRRIAGKIGNPSKIYSLQYELTKHEHFSTKNKKETLYAKA